MKLFKVLLTLALVTLIQNSAYSQIPNAGFENWTNGEPDNWFSDNIMGVGTPVTQSSESHSGSSAIKLEVVSTIIGDFPGYIWSGAGAYGGFPVTQAYGSLTGYYQFNKIGTAAVYIAIYTQKNGTFIGGGGIEIDNGTSGYSQFVVPIYQSDVPDTASIWIAVEDSSGQGGTAGAYVLIDDLAMGGAVDVNDKIQAVQTFSLKQNYPNPFNPSTTIEYSVPQESFVNLTVYDVLGEKVASLVNDVRLAGTYKNYFNATNLSSGIYIVRMNATSNDGIIRFTKSYKMTLIK
jgi:hypothetical protein